MIDVVPMPEIDAGNAFFWEGTEQGELRVETCGDCRQLRFPPRIMCPHCQSSARSWTVMSGRGAIWSFVIVHRPVLPALQHLVPYNVVVVELAEDSNLRMVGNLVNSPFDGINSVSRDLISIGDKVNVVFQPDEGQSGLVLPRWRLTQ